MSRLKFVPSDTERYLHFPVNRVVSYLIRDRQTDDRPTRVAGGVGGYAWAVGPRYEVYVLTGVEPTVQDYAISALIGGYAEYATARAEVERAVTRADALQSNSGTTAPIVAYLG